MNGTRLALFGFGYPAAIAVIARWMPVVRERRWRWLVVHHLGMAAIIAGYVSRRTAVGVAANTSWLVASSVWYAVGGRRAPAGCPVTGDE